MVEKVRLRYRKKGLIRFISHRDLLRLLHRMIRRAGIPVAFSGGYSPHMKVSLGLSLAVGWESEEEIADISLVEDMQTEVVLEKLLLCAPEGVIPYSVEIKDEKTPKIISGLKTVNYLIKHTSQNNFSEKCKKAFSRLAKRNNLEEKECFDSELSFSDWIENWKIDNESVFLELRIIRGMSFSPLKLLQGITDESLESLRQVHVTRISQNYN
jgi:radical SAM-linked protein